MTRPIGWRDLLKRLVHVGSEATYPLVVFEVKLPSARPWPAALPSCPPLEELYHLCDGGYLAHFNIASLSEAVDETARWVSTMRGWRDGIDVLDPAKHIVFGSDSGCPLIVDTASGEVRTFQVDGGDWEPGWPTVEAFFEWLFFEAGPEDWSKALVELGAPERKAAQE